MTEHQIGLLLEENRAFIERIAWYSVGIVNLFADVDHTQKIASDAVGTGTACKWKGHALILTAEHVVAKAKPSNLAFLLRVDDALNWEGSDKKERVIERVFLPVEDIVCCKENDLAAIVLRTKELTRFKMQFCDFPKGLAKSRTPKSEGCLVFHGYPRDQQSLYSKVKKPGVEANYFYLKPIILVGTIAQAPSKPLPSAYDPARDVLVNYTPDDPSMEPFGFSGAAAWSERKDRSGVVWTAEPVLFGVQTRAIRSSKLLLVVGAPTVREFLQKEF